MGCALSGRKCTYQRPASTRHPVQTGSAGVVGELEKVYDMVRNLYQESSIAQNTLARANVTLKQREVQIVEVSLSVIMANIDQLVHPITSSFGVAELSQDEDESSFLKRVDAALYRAKETVNTVSTKFGTADGTRVSRWQV